MNSTFDEALERLRGTGSEVAGGVAPNHGPMAAEALVALGCDDVVVAWADRYRRQLDAMPPPRSPVTAENWAQALGAIERFGDWVAFFRAQLAEAPWRVVFRRVDRPPVARDAFRRRPRTDSHCARAARAGGHRDRPARRR